MDQVGGLSDSPLDYNNRNTIYIDQSGLYSLILRSEKPEAKIFKKWITSELLPTIRSTGSYIIPKTINKQIILKNEKDLHYKVINFIKDSYPDIILIPGLGEHQTTSQLRCDAYNKGYTAGQPDILILNSHKTYSGFALELKSPLGKGELSSKQSNYLNNLKLQNYKILVSDNYDMTLINLINYFRDTRICCQYCIKKFKNHTTLATHHKYFHRITTPSDIIEY